MASLTLSKAKAQKHFSESGCELITPYTLCFYQEEKMNNTEIPVTDVRLVMELYPRLETKMVDSLVEQYRDSIDDLPPIVVARGGILVDGMHRWQAHIREKRETIKAIDLGDISDTEIFSEAVRLNASHGRQLSRSEKKILQRVFGRTWRMLKKESASLKSCVGSR